MLHRISQFWGHHVLMGKFDHEWQDTDYVLGMFGKTMSSARRAYADFVAKGLSAGHRPELVGGGLVRSVGGWSALKSFRKIGIRIKGDERILGGSDFVEKTLKQANERLEKKPGFRLPGQISRR